MAKKAVAVRLTDAAIEWADGYARERSELDGVRVSRQDVLESAIDSFREDAERGVPELRSVIRRQSGVRGEDVGVGDCPRRSGALGHVWRSPEEDPVRPCRFCGLPGRSTRAVGGAVVEVENHMASASAERAALFSQLRPPVSSGWKAKG